MTRNYTPQERIDRMKRIRKYLFCALIVALLSFDLWVVTESTGFGLFLLLCEVAAAFALVTNAIDVAIIDNERIEKEQKKQQESTPMEQD